MNISLPAFADELALIKVAQGNEEGKFKSEVPTRLATRFLKSAPKYALGAGLGYGTGWLIGEKTRPWMLKNMTPTGRKALMGAVSGLGAIGSLALWDAMRTASKEEDAALAKKRKKTN